MKAVILCEDWLIVPKSRGWHLLECPTIPHVVAALKAGFPKGTEFMVYVDHPDLTWREVSSPVSERRALREALADERHQLPSGASQAFFEDAVRQSDGEYRAIAWYESQPFLGPLVELLSARNGQCVSKAIPLGAALSFGWGEGGQRASLSWVVLPGACVVIGRDITGKPFRARTARMSGQELTEETRVLLARAGVPIGGKAAMPARLRVIELAGSERPPETEILRHSVGAQNHVDQATLAPGRSAGAILRSLASESLVKTPGLLRARKGLEIATLVAASVLVGVGASSYLGIERFQAQLDATKKSLREEQALLQRIERLQDELGLLDRLYGADAGWSEVVAKDCLEKLDALLPADWSIDLVECEAKGHLLIKARWWGESEGPSEASIKEISERIRHALQRKGNEVATYDPATRQLTFRGMGS